MKSSCIAHAKNVSDVLPINVIVISRSDDERRRSRISAVMPSFIDWRFLDAVDGHSPESIPRNYASLLPEHFWGGGQIKPGAFGCFVSHYSAWEACANSGKWMLVIEDDAVFNDRVQKETLEGIIGICDTSVFDVVFLNKRAVNWNHQFEARTSAAAIPVRPLREVVEGIVAAGLIPPNPNSPGGDCYLLRPSGAQNLMECANRNGVVVGVDWFMVGCALSDARLEGSWDMPRRASQCLRSMKSLNVGIAGDWLAEADDRAVGGSVIRHTDLIDLNIYVDRMLTRAGSDVGDTPVGHRPLDRHRS